MVCTHGKKNQMIYLKIRCPIIYSEFKIERSICGTIINSVMLWTFIYFSLYWSGNHIIAFFLAFMLVLDFSVQALFFFTFDAHLKLFTLILSPTRTPAISHPLCV